MGVNDLMILDLETLQEITGDVGRVKRPSEADAAAVSLQTETVPDLAQLVESEAKRAPAAEAPRKKRQFTLREEAPSPKRADINRMPIARYGGAGVYSMPVRYTGDGRFEKGRDHMREPEPDSGLTAIETADFDLKSVEDEIRRRRRHRRLDDE